MAHIKALKQGLAMDEEMPRFSPIDSTVKSIGDRKMGSASSVEDEMKA
jgi:hypothetical protein